MHKGFLPSTVFPPFVRVLACTALWGTLFGGCPSMEPPQTPIVDMMMPPAPPYTIKAFERARIVSKGGVSNFQNVRTDVDFRNGPFEKVLLILDLESTCYPFEKWQENPPPAGQNWPADCDAFDRNFEVTLDQPSSAEGPPALELARAITPFGGPQHLEVDITDVANGLPGKHNLQVHISTWSDSAGKVTGSDGGWTVSAKIDVRPGTPPRRVLAVKSLFNLNENQAMPRDFTFETPKGTTSARLEYRVTGHGGGEPEMGACIGPAEEFCRRTHTLTIDGSEVKRYVPWRSDCSKACTSATYNGRMYCLENPCGLPQSVRAPRANWCPGSLTPPTILEEEAPTEVGRHIFRYSINRVAQGGSWRMSATYFAFGDP